MNTKTNTQNTFPLLLVFLLISCSSFGQLIQRSSNIWYFGDRAGIDFNSNPPRALQDGQVNTQEGVASIADRNGELLFYTDGVTVWDRTHTAMPGAAGNLNGHFSSSQSAFIVPHPGDSTLFYLFTIDELGNNDGFSYTLIDLTLAGNGSLGMPLGDAVSNERNVQLVTPVAEKVTAVLRPDFSAYWVITHGWNNNRFYAFEINCNGLNPNPVISDVGNTHSGGTNDINAVGYMKSSLDGRRLALANRRRNSIDVFDFDFITGRVSNQVEIRPNDNLLYGIEFSPSGEFLYIGGRTVVSRYSFLTGILADVPFDNPSAANGSNSVRALQLGPDGNIYVSLNEREFISVIEDPDGNDPMLRTNGLNLDPDNASRNCRYGLPSVFNFNLFVSSDTLVLSACPNDSVEYNGNFYLAGSTSELSIINSVGCEATLILTVEAMEVSSDTLMLSACPNDSVEYNGNFYLTGSTNEIPSINSMGCESTLILQVEELDVSSDTLVVDACPNDSVEYDGNFYLTGSTNEIPIINSLGCDATLILQVEAMEVSSDTLVVDACPNDSVEYNGNFYLTGSTNEIPIINSLGCEATLILQVEAVEVGSESLLLSACPNDSVEYNGNFYAAGSTNLVPIINSRGCEATLILTVETLEVASETFVLEACKGTFFEYYGVQIPAGGQQSFTFTDPQGCDSTLTIIVDQLEVIAEDIEVTVCEGEAFIYQNEAYPVGTDTVFEIINTIGCDSLISLRVAAAPSPNVELWTQDACQDSIDGSITVQNVSGGMPPFEFSIDGVNFFSDSLINGLAPGIYDFWVRDARQCLGQRVVEIREIPQFLIQYREPIITCEDDSVRVQVDLLNMPVSEANWQWSTGVDTNFAYFSQPGLYSVEISNACQTLIEEINIDSEGRMNENIIYIPNAFSPNFDGINDKFQLFPAPDIEILDFELHVFNRWGAPVFQSNDIQYSWDGHFDGQLLNPGVYVWWLEINANICKRNRIIFLEGDVTIMN